MTDSGVVVTERLRDHKIVKPIIYGNTAALLPRKKETTIHIIQFKLHESYDNHVRVLDTPPFEITETGWGEFEVQIKLFFIDVNEKPVTAFYYLRLFQPVVELPDKSKMVVNEYYDEIVFNEPTEQMYRILATNTPQGRQKSICGLRRY
uniref:Protein AF-9 homolog n=1 Tax=Ditylenchus dipsaci TaxID=166011 RepID=A0A915D1H8_9BILA